MYSGYYYHGFDLIFIFLFYVVFLALFFNFIRKKKSKELLIAVRVFSGLLVLDFFNRFADWYGLYFSIPAALILIAVPMWDWISSVIRNEKNGTDFSGSPKTDNFCSQCGTPLRPGKKFCTNCGVKLSDTEDNETI